MKNKTKTIPKCDWCGTNQRVSSSDITEFMKMTGTVPSQLTSYNVSQDFLQVGSLTDINIQTNGRAEFCPPCAIKYMKWFNNRLAEKKKGIK